MNAYIQYLLYLLQQCFKPVKSAVCVCFLIIVISFFVFRRYSFFKALLKSEIALSALMCYITLVLCVTLTRGISEGKPNLHLFRAFREVWNTFSATGWLHLILNILLFAPVGILLPLVSKKLRHVWLVMIIGFLLSLGIELTQFLTKVGIFDVDDMLANSIGCILGYCSTMTVLTMVRKVEGPTWVKFGYYGALLTSAFAVASVYAVYVIQPYGNLEDAWSYKVNTNQISWNLSCTLNDEKNSAYVFYTQPYTATSADEFAENILNKLGCNNELNIYHYDSVAVYTDLSMPGYTIQVSYKDGGFNLSYHYEVNEREPTWTTLNREELLSKLSELGIVMPNFISISYGNNGWHIINLDMEYDGAEMWHGTFKVRYAEKGNIFEIENNLISYTPCKEESIITMLQAYQRLCNGYFSGDYFSRISPDTVEVVSCELEYQIDSKSFFQPVYIFSLVLDNQYDTSVMIPALK